MYKLHKLRGQKYTKLKVDIKQPVLAEHKRTCTMLHKENKINTIYQIF